MASGRAVYRAVVASDLEFEGIDYKEAVRYIALTHTAAQVRAHPLRRILCWRNKKKGVRPTLTGPAPLVAETGEENQ